MARMSGTDTMVSSARSNSRSLRTTIPVFVVEALDLKEGMALDWKLDKNGGKWIAIFTSKR